METSITPVDKFNGVNFHTWKVNIQMQLMNKNLWGIVSGKEKEPIDVSKLLEQKTRDDEAKAIIELAMSNPKLHQVDLKNPSMEIWGVTSTEEGEILSRMSFI